MEESQEHNREVANATQDVKSTGGVDEGIDINNQAHSYPRRIANNSNMSSGKNH